VSTRFAPTPSGFLHAGNAVNALVTARLAEEQGLTLALRIDDADAPRYRAEFVDDIFDVLDWLGIRPDAGPRDRADLEARHSQRLRTEYYRSEVGHLRERDARVYACLCSRADAARAGAAGCVRGCSTAGLQWAPGESALRIALPGVIPDPVLWRRDDLPAYHLVSVIEDRDLGTSLVVRGDDLRETTRVQRALAPYLGAEDFVGATFVHHRLITGADGAKLSKSTLGSGPLDRTPQVRAHVEAMAAEVLSEVGQPDESGAGDA
jgi:glutamyl/glutaminyl-tRNA synthetase